jgi:sugar/nucleoside kinase (ribokinase family)
VFNLHDNSSEEISAPKVEARDTTGSGDVFGAVFSVLAAKGMQPGEAAATATKWASWNTELDSIDALLSSPLPKFIAAQTKTPRNAS